MVFDFAAQPPELISAKIYSGPGAESLQIAAAAWDALSGELQSTATQFEATVASLVGGDWTGPSAEAAAAAAEPFVAWLSTTAGQAEQTASQARAAASAYETALAATVPPAEIAANRAELLTLVQANIFGQYNAAIAALEAQYGEFWGQDVAAITGYSASAQSATTGLGSFTEAPQTTNDAGRTAQAASTATAAASAPLDPFTQILTQLETTSNSFSKALTTFDSTYTNFFTTAFGILPGGSSLAPMYQNLFTFANNIGNQATYTNVINSTTSLGISQWKNFFVYQPWSHGIGLGSLKGGLFSPGQAAAGLGARAVTASLGSAQTLGHLSVPPSWAGATPAVRLAVSALPEGSFAATAAPAAGLPLSLLNESTLGSLTGGALGSPISRVVSSTGVRAKVTTPARTKGPVPLDKVIAKLQESPDDVQHWNVDEAGLDDLLAKLSTKAGIHAVHVTDGKATAEAAKSVPETG